MSSFRKYEDASDGTTDDSSFVPNSKPSQSQRDANGTAPAAKKVTQKKRTSTYQKKRSVFPLRLYDMLMDCEANGRVDIVSWTPDGRGCIVHDDDRFDKELRPIYFPDQSKIRSFFRQINEWGFIREDHRVFKHHHFVRGDRDFIERHLKRGQKIKTKAFVEESSPVSPFLNSSKNPRSTKRIKRPMSDPLKTNSGPKIDDGSRDNEVSDTKASSIMVEQATLIMRPPTSVQTGVLAQQAGISFRGDMCLESIPQRLTNEETSRTVSPNGGVSCTELFPDIAVVLGLPSSNTTGPLFSQQTPASSSVDLFQRDAMYLEMETREIVQEINEAPLVPGFNLGCGDENEPIRVQATIAPYSNIPEDAGQQLLEFLGTPDKKIVEI